ncbi:MAG: carboxypeptidase-like regulatory domain-containing protein [Planctomycetaceae bacterium]|nr:carboxypeptidase-like regulatory domain-containing protein [Planctomycetaceae bacterium]
MAGCSKNDGPKTEYVEGNVTFNGQPLSKCLVVFHPVNESGVAASGITNEQGIFRLTSLRGGTKDGGAIAGEYRVAVSRDKDEPSSFREEKNAGGTDKIPVFESLIPLKYNDPAKSGLTATVEKKKNQFQFALEK